MADGTDDRMDLARFLHRLAVDPDALAEYLDDPERAVERADLDDDDRAALRAGRDAVMESIGRIRAVEEHTVGREVGPNQREVMFQLNIPLVFPHLTKPPVEPDHVTKPPVEPDHVTKPPVEPDHLTKPPTEPDHVTKPPVEPDHLTKPPTEPDHVTKPPSEPGGPS